MVSNVARACASFWEVFVNQVGQESRAKIDQQSKSPGVCLGRPSGSGSNGNPRLKRSKKIRRRSRGEGIVCVFSIFIFINLDRISAII